MKIIDSIEKTLTSPSLYWQSLSLALCFIASYFFYSLIKESSNLNQNINQQGQLEF